MDQFQRKYGQRIEFINEKHIRLANKLRELDVGDKIYFPNEKRGFEIKAKNNNYIIATRPHFKTVMYTIIDLAEYWCAPDNMVFCSGYETEEDVNERMQELIDGKIECSTRRGKLIDFDRYKKKGSKEILWFKDDLNGK